MGRLPLALPDAAAVDSFSDGAGMGRLPLALPSRPLLPMRMPVGRIARPRAGKGFKR